MIICIIYWIAGYWAVGETIWANKIIYGDGGKIFCQRAAYGLFFGFILIPWAIIKRLLSR